MTLSLLVVNQTLYLLKTFFLISEAFQRSELLSWVTVTQQTKLAIILRANLSSEMGTLWLRTDIPSFYGWS